jgi:flagellar biogenesis protein FliO
MRHQTAAVLLALSLLLAVPAFAEQPAHQTQATETAEKPAAAPIKSHAIGSAVPKLAALSEKSMWALGSITLVFLLCAGVYKKVAEKRGLLNNVNLISIVSRKPLGPRQALLLVEVEGQRFFIAQGSETVQLISPINHSAEFDETLNDFDEFIEARKVARS